MGTAAHESGLSSSASGITWITLFQKQKKYCALYLQEQIDKRVGIKRDL